MRFPPEFRSAWRTLSRRPFFTLTTLFILGVAIAVNTGLFTLVDALLFKGAPGVEDTAGLVDLSRDIQGSHWDLSYPMVREFQTRSHLLEDAAAIVLTPAALRIDSDPSVHLTLSVTSSYFSVLRLKPAWGRFFDESEGRFPKVKPVVVISHGLWERRFGSSPGVLGKSVSLNGYPLQIVGVAPVRFGGHASIVQVDLFVPLGLPVPGLPTASGLQPANSAVVEGLGRLRPGVSADQAREELTTLAKGLLETGPRAQSGEVAISVIPWSPLPAPMRGGVKIFFALLQVVVGLVLALACLSVANTMLSWTVQRRREMAIRKALGATRRTILAQLFLESVALFGGAGLVGVSLSRLALRLLLSFKPPLPAGFSISLDVSPDYRTFLYSIALSILCGLLLTIGPFLWSIRLDPVKALKESAGDADKGGIRWRSLLVAGQMAFTLVILTCAGLFLRSLSAIDALDPGWQPEGVYAASLDLDLAGYSRQRGAVFYRELAAKAHQSPAVVSAALAAKLPLGGRSSLGDVTVAGMSPPPGRPGFEAYFNTVTPAFFETLQIPLLRGRDFQETDNATSQRVAIISRSMAARLWPGREAVGERFQIGDLSLLVVGVAGDVGYRSPEQEAPNFYYLPLSQRYNSQMTLYIKPALGEVQLAEHTRSLISELDAGLPLLSIQPLEELLSVFLLPQRLAAWTSGLMGVFGLCLGAVGVYGLTAFITGLRTREIGVRLALGALPSDIVRLLVGQGLRAPLIGMIVGLVGSVGLAVAMSGFLPGITPWNPAAFGFSLLILVAVTLLAIALPSRRASRLDPVKALRWE